RARCILRTKRRSASALIATCLAGGCTDHVGKRRAARRDRAAKAVRATQGEVAEAGDRQVVNRNAYPRKATSAAGPRRESVAPEGRRSERGSIGCGLDERSRSRSNGPSLSAIIPRPRSGQRLVARASCGGNVDGHPWPAQREWFGLTNALTNQDLASGLLLITIDQRLDGSHRCSSESQLIPSLTRYGGDRSSLIQTPEGLQLILLGAG